ncbi:hypothetical protein CAB17_11565 [Legionella sainthelensi]|uniref:Uncharacterized protein n=1 Tax=Legionella sainthelensi TaxID=28087 RepID=A0A2H5FM40_9GAMM|nr:hypothetical protein CAB17_11565 [Legionella sainthelensi]
MFPYIIYINRRIQQSLISNKINIKVQLTSNCFPFVFLLNKASKQETKNTFLFVNKYSHRISIISVALISVKKTDINIKQPMPKSLED